jgi:hypothetical protein
MKHYFKELVIVFSRVLVTVVLVTLLIGAPMATSLNAWDIRSNASDKRILEAYDPEIIEATVRGNYIPLAWLFIKTSHINIAVITLLLTFLGTPRKKK